MNLYDFFAAATAAFSSVVSDLPSTALDAPSGAGEWNGRQVIEHVLGVNAQARAMAAGVDVRVDGSVPDPLDPADPARSYARSASATAEAFTPVHLQQRLLASPMGLFSGRVVFGVTALENLVHAWDLAVSGGRAVEFDPVAVGYAFRAIEDMPDVWHNFRHWEVYGEPLTPPDDATAAERLLALLGRDTRSLGAPSPRQGGEDPRRSVRPSARPADDATTTDTLTALR